MSSPKSTTLRFYDPERRLSMYVAVDKRGVGWLSYDGLYWRRVPVEQLPDGHTPRPLGVTETLPSNWTWTETRGSWTLAASPPHAASEQDGTDGTRDIGVRCYLCGCPDTGHESDDSGHQDKGQP